MGEEEFIKVPYYEGRYIVNESYRAIAEALVSKFSEIRHVPVDMILFVDDTKGSGKHKNKVKDAQITLIPRDLQDVIYQLTGRRISYIMEFYKKNIEMKSREHIVALVYHELRHIDKSGALIPHDIEDWIEMYTKLGADWTSENAEIPDLLDENVNWDSITSPNLFMKLKLVK